MTECGPCSGGLMCDGNLCVDCVEDTPCTPEDPCHVGRVSCSAGQATCVDSSEPAPDGTACGTNLSCRSGLCRICEEGLACTPEDVCHAGTTSCDGGVQVCVDTGEPGRVGLECGSNQVCMDGSCMPCAEMLPCAVADAPCTVGYWQCPPGLEMFCFSMDFPFEDGTPCGEDAVCGGGVCNACAAGGDCYPEDSLCHVGTLACDTGYPVCTDTGAERGTGAGCVDGTCSGSTCVLDREWVWWVPLPCNNDNTMFSKSGGVVSDSETGLQWQETMSETTYSWADADAHCSGLDLGGHQDWRVPTLVEMLSIVEYCLRGPASPWNILTDTPTSAWFWTATHRYDDASQSFAVLSYSGITDVHANSTLSQVRCVR